MRCAMLNRSKILSLLLAAFWVSASVPTSHAAGLPVLQWEAGKQEVISIRGATAQMSWSLFLVGGNTSQKFTSSKLGASGSMIYQINLPKNQELGSYIVEARSPNSLTRQLAGINIVKMKQFNILQIPNKLFYICLTFIFVGVGISTLRSARYSRIEYLRPTRKHPTNIFLKRFFEMRQILLDELQPSLFKFQLIKEGELFHNLSPWIWALSPFGFFSFGAYVGTHSLNYSQAMLTPAIIYAVIAALAVFDPFSGIAAGIGFFISVALTGVVSNLHSLLSALAYIAGWFVPGMLASLFEQSLRHDWVPRRPERFFREAPILFAGCVGGATFYATELLTNSFSNQFGPVIDPGMFAPIVLAIVIVARIKIDQFLIRDLHLRGENYQIRSITLPRVVAPQTVILSTIYIFGAMYSWTGDFGFSTGMAVIAGLAFGLLLFRFESSFFKSAIKLQRHILIEALIAITLCGAIFIYLGRLPISIVSKGELIVLTSGILFLIHAFYSALHDAAHRKNNSPGNANTRASLATTEEVHI